MIVNRRKSSKKWKNKNVNYLKVCTSEQTWSTVLSSIFTLFICRGDFFWLYYSLFKTVPITRNISCSLTNYNVGAPPCCLLPHKVCLCLGLLIFISSGVGLKDDTGSEQTDAQQLPVTKSLPAHQSTDWKEAKVSFYFSIVKSRLDKSIRRWRYRERETE